MATKGSKMLTLRDVKSGTLPDGSFDRAIVEMMYDENPSLRDIPWQDCNNGSQHISTIRTGLPTAVWTEYYKGVPGSKSSKKQVMNATGSLGSKIVFDYNLYLKEKANNSADQFVADEASAHGEALGIAAATALFYGNVANDPKGINGFFKSYATCGSIVSDDKDIANYVINGKGADSSVAALRSIMLVGWGSRSMFGLVPRGGSMGLVKGTIDTQQIADENGNFYKAGIQDLSYNVGLCIKDFRYGCRIANLQIDKWDATGAPKFFNLLTSAKIRAKSNGDIKRVWYMSKKTWEVIALYLGQITRANAFTYGDANNGNTPDTLLGIPVALDDALETNETLVS